MAISINKLDWTYLRTFVAVAEHGSLTAAAHKLSLSQPTAGRHIKTAEAVLETELFTRGTNGLTITDAGLMLLEPAREMAASAAKLENLAAGRSNRFSGTVKITASVVVSHYLLPNIISKIRKRQPDIEIELLPSDTTENLLFREADIALRMYRPTQLDIIAKHIADQPIALYAADSLFDGLNQPQNFDDLANLPFVGFDKSDTIIKSMRDMGFLVDRHFFGVRCDEQAVYWRLVCAGCGIGAMQTAIGDKEPSVTKLGFQPEMPPIPIWLAAPEALRTSARIKYVWDMLVEELHALLGRDDKPVA